MPVPDQPTFPTRKGWTLPTLERLGVTFEAGRFVFHLETDDGVACGAVRYADDGRRPKMVADAGTTREPWPRPEVIEGPTLYVVEGEPDALSMAELGLPAVAYPGVGKASSEWPHRLIYGPDGRRERVVFLSDCDDGGRKKARALAGDVAALGVSAFVADLAAERRDGFDVGDLLVAALDDDPEGGRDLARRIIEARVAEAEAVAPAVTPAEPDAAGEALTVRASDVQSRAIRWLWRGRLAFGYLTVATGLEKIGKSVFWCWVIGGLTRGDLDGGPDAPADVLVLANEDGIEDTWKPRLDLAGADLERCHFVRVEALGAAWNVRDGIDRLRQAVTDTGARLVLIDAVLEHVPDAKGGENASSATFVRRAMWPLRGLLRAQGVAGVVSLHPPKGRPGPEFRDMVQTSQAWTAVSRLGLLVAWHPDDREFPEDDRRRVVVRGAGNVGRNPGSLEFRVVGRTYVADDGESDEREVVEAVAPSPVGLRDLARDTDEVASADTKVARAAALMSVALGDGEWHPSADVFALLDAAEVGGKATVAAARKRAGVQTRKVGFQGPWEWRSAKAGDLCALARAKSLSARPFGFDPSDPFSSNDEGSKDHVVDDEPAVDLSKGSARIGHARAHARDGTTDGQGELLEPPDRTGGRTFDATPVRPAPDDDDDRERKDLA
jgi:putative DNA primase/helicase